MHNTAWYSNVARAITVIVGVGLYTIALMAFLRKPKKKTAAFSPCAPELSLKENLYNGPERRIHKRTRLDLEVRYKLSGRGIIRIFREGIVRDLSEGGMLLETNEKLAMDDVLEFKLKLPEFAHFMLIRGKIIWKNEIEQGKWYNYGISICEIEPNDRKFIAKFVESRKCDVKQV